MSTVEKFPSQAASRRPSVPGLLLAGVLYWIGFRRNDVGPATARPTSTGGSIKGARAASGASRPEPRSWRDVFLQVWSDIGRHRVLAIAAGVTFYGLLAIFPAVAAIVTLYGLFADPATLHDQLNSLAGTLPSGALDVIGEQVSRISANGRSSLSLAFITGLLISLWSSNAGMKAIFDALNIVYNVEERRSFGNSISFLFHSRWQALCLCSSRSQASS